METKIEKLIGASYKEWCLGDHVVIDAPTGSGKTYFITNTLLHYAAIRGKKLLYLVNRSALKGQICEQILKMDPIYSQHIYVDTYQDFAVKKFYEIRDGEQHLTPYGREAFQCKYWVFDEAHYFLNDSSFNDTATRCIEILEGNSMHHINIYMTATVPYLYLTLYRYISSNSLKSKKKSNADRLAFDSVVNFEMFKQRVLISTSVLDNGINIKDPTVKHLVIDSYDKTSFLQMLGRKRNLNDETVNLYIKAHTLGSIQKRFHNSVHSIVMFYYFFMLIRGGELKPDGTTRRAPSLDSLKKYIANGHYKKPYCYYVRDVRKLGFGPYDKSTLEKDKLALLDLFEIDSLIESKVTYSYYYFMSFFERCYNNNVPSNDILVWLSEQLSWIDNTYDETHWINYDKQQHYKSVLETLLKESYDYGSLLNKVEQQKFKNTVLAYESELRPPSSICGKAATIGKINNALRAWGYPYRLKSKQKQIGGKRQTYWWVTIDDQ